MSYVFPSPPSFWGSDVDDIYVVIEEEQVDAFTTHINNNLPSIKFTMEREENGKLPMLDIMIHRADDGKLKVTIFRKPIHTDQYLSMDSHYPLQHKLGVIRTLEHREQNTGHWPRGQSDKVAKLQSCKQYSESWDFVDTDGHIQCVL